nr:zinc knuckle CX2CX4HX4C [Tanacetum cinerariifolium]
GSNKTCGGRQYAGRTNAVNKGSDQNLGSLFVDGNSDVLTKGTGNVVESTMGVVGASASEPCKAKMNFRSLYSDNLCNGVDFTIPRKVVKRLVLDENTVHGYFIGKRVAFSVMEYYVRNNWEKYGLTRIVMNSKGFFFFIFNTTKGLEDLLENGSWMIRNIPVILKKRTQVC